MHTIVDTAIEQSTSRIITRPLSDEETRGIELISQIELTLIRERVLKEGNVPESLVDEAITEYRKFLTLFRLGFTNIGMCSHYVDEIWHSHILFTRAYMTFCDKAFGRYLHHAPFTSLTPKENQDESSRNFFQAYRETFGPIHHLWSGVAQANCLPGCDGTPSCKTCNDSCTSPGPGCSSPSCDGH